MVYKHYIRSHYFFLGKGSSVFDYMIDQAVQQELASEKDWPIDATNSYIKYLDDVSLLKDMKVS